jgi:hypothetical protein
MLLQTNGAMPDIHWLSKASSGKTRAEYSCRLIFFTTSTMKVVSDHAKTTMDAASASDSPDCSLLTHVVNPRKAASRLQVGLSREVLGCIIRPADLSVGTRGMMPNRL